jgi:hypothetical protein
MKKSELIETLQEFPEDFSIEDLIEKLVVLQKIEIAQQKVEEGKVYSETEAKRKLAQWLK